MTENLQPAAGASHSSKCYTESLARLDRHVDHIPPGWQRLYGDLRHALSVFATIHRMNIRIDGAWHEDGHLRVESDTSDPVIQGVLRKARMRAMHTCSQCGKRGKRRELVNWQEATLCGRCAAPRLLSLNIERVLALERCGSLALREELQHAPEAVLIRAAAEAGATEQGLRKHFVLSELSDKHLRAWLERIRAFVEASPTQDQD